MARHFGSGNTDRLETSSIIPPGSAGTISIWVLSNWAYNDGFEHDLWRHHKTTATTGTFAYIKYSDNNIYVGWNGAGLGDQRITLSGSGIFVLNTWEHHVFSWDSAVPNCTLYVNGSSVATRGTALTTFTCDLLAIGNTPGGGSNNSISGNMADYCSWNVAMTLGEVQSLSKGCRPSSIRPANIIAYYPVDGEQSPEPDFSGSGKNLTVTGAIWGYGPPITTFTSRWPSNLPPVSVPTFVPAWAMGTNLPVLGTGMY